MKSIVKFTFALMIGLLAASAHADTTVKLTGDDMMKLNLKSFTVKAGEKVTLKFSHTGKLPKEAMGHNIVILKAGTDVNKFAQAAAMAAKTGYIPPAGKKYILAQTKMLGGGQSTTVSFTAPAKGNYTYLCTFPGHAALMKGTMIVK